MLSRHRRFLLAVGLLSYLCEDSTAVKPKMSPSTDQIILKEGEPLRLLCSGEWDIFFDFPFHGADVSNAVYSDTSPIEINKTRDENGTYWYDFRRPKTVFGDTDWYGCSHYSISHNYSDPDVSWIYVYVESEEVQFVARKYLRKINATAGDNVVLPCKPTSPDAQVSIARFIETEGVVHYYYDDIPSYTYDPKIGFKLEEVAKFHSGIYTCSLPSGQKVEFEVYIDGPPTLPKPVINDTLAHVKKGESVYLKCTIYSIQGVEDFNLFWEPPQNTDRITTWSDERTNPNFVFEKSVIMKIENVIYRDENTYSCKATYLFDEQTTEMYLQVHESINPFILIRNPYTHYEAYEGDYVEWLVQVEAYPPPQLRWLNPSGDEIPTTLWPHSENKIISDNACCLAMLSIYNLDIHDMGTYTIEANNQYEHETFSIMLDVIAKPKLYIRKRRTHYFRHQVDKIECHVEAFPEPNITWTYRKCPNYPSCENGTVHYLTDSRENVTETHLRSTVTAILETSGELTCSACNTVGCGNVTEGVSVSDEFGVFGIILTKDIVAEGDDWELICAASVQNYSDIFNWSSESGPIVQSDRISINRESTEFAYRSILKIQNVKIEDSQEYICRGKSTDNLTASAGYRLEVEASLPPTIIYTNLNNDEITIDISTRGSGKVHFYCFVDGMPKPNVTWLKDDTELVLSKENYKCSNGSQQLKLKYPLDVDSSGVYTCRAQNRIGKVEVHQRITITGFKIVTTIPVGVIVLLAALAAIVLILVIYFAIRIHSERIMKKELMEAGLMHFEKGAVESLNPELTVDDQADLLPYDKKWEFPRDRLKLGKQLGSGAFGVVLKAEAMGICEREAVTTVAVKMVRRGPNLFSISALASELKIMIHLGKHLNIVNLLGACTKNILKRELLVIVEFCRFGNLHDYLFKNRSGFINQVDPVSGKLDLSIGRDLLGKTVSPSASNRLKSVESSASVSKNRNSHSDSVQCHNTDLHDLNTSADDPVVMSTRSGSSNCQGDNQDSNLKPICTQDLLSWAFQVARGMEYLSQRRILHGDLATRNILLADDNVVKICDFGLAKSMYKEDIYKKKSDCPLPIKWLSVETMRDRIFSTQSDVWSFGIVLWELFTLAETPYPGVQAEMVYQKLIEGYRMEQPEYATSEVYDVMRQCWNAEPSLRPSFTELADSVGNLLEDNVRAHYIELNAPYLGMNRTLQEGGGEDYLTMVSPPDYVMLSRPAQDHTNSTASANMTESGYLNTSPIDAVELSPMLKKEVDDPYLKPISIHKRMIELGRNRGTSDRGYSRSNRTTWS